MMINLPYGKERIEFFVEDKYFCELVEPNNVKAAENVYDEIIKSLDNPIGGKRLEDIIKPGQKVNIISDDITRPTPVNEILPALLERLERLGIERNDVKIVMALGSHRYMTEHEMIQKVGKEIYEQYKVVNSEFRNEKDLVHMGTAPGGVEIYASRIAVECDIRIGIGNIVPHPTMGWSGGAKILFPGVTGEKTVSQFHMQQGREERNMFGMENCPVRLNVEKWVDNIGLHFIINTVLTNDFKIYKVVSGDYVKAQRKGVEYAKEVYGKRLKKKADIIVISSYPSDMDLWQSTKGVLCADNGLNDGGTVILVSPNYEGVGPHPQFARYMGMDNSPDILEAYFNGEIDVEDPLGLSVGAAMSRIRQRRNLVIVSDGISKEEAETCGMRYYPLKDIQKAIDEAVRKYENPTVTAVTHGGETYIYC